jgi:hypothetical protein
MFVLKIDVPETELFLIGGVSRGPLILQPF